MEFYELHQDRTCQLDLKQVEGIYINNPNGTTKNGKIIAISRVSGSKTPLFFLANHSAKRSVKAPPKYTPNAVPIIVGI